MLRIALPCIATAVLLAIRIHNDFANPQFFAEDGYIFFSQQFTYGAFAILKPWAGYLILFPRLTAFAASWFPPLYAPSIYLGAYVLIALWTTATIAAANLRYAPIYAALLFAVPHTGEAFGTITNIQWITAAALPVLACSDTQGRGWRANEMVFIVATCFSGPFAVFALPLFGWRWWTRNDRYSLILVVFVGAIALVQLGLIMTTERAQVQAPPPLTIMVTSVYRVFSTLALGKVGLDLLTAPLALALSVAAVSAALIREQREIGICLVVFTLLLLAAASWSPLDSSGYTVASASDRYFYGAKLAVIWLLICATQYRPRFSGAFIVATIVSLNPFKGSGVTQFIKPAMADLHWKAQAAAILPGKPARIAINPRGWFVVLPAYR
jgi:hypothetical protein